MAKIILNNKEYQINDATLAPAIADLKSHLSTVMNGTGATINFGGAAYGIDSTKLSTATNAFVTHLGTIAGSGSKVKVGEVEYGISSDKVAGAVSELEIILRQLHSEPYTAGLYQTGAIALYEEQGASAIEDMLIKSWDELLTDGTVHVVNKVVYTNLNMETNENSSSVALDGDLMLPADGSVTILGDFNGETFEGNLAFTMCENLTGIFIPEGVVSIGVSAFSGCNLTSIIIPGSVTSISRYAFFELTSLTRVIIQNGVTTIEDRAFEGCTSLTNIEIPNSISYIGEGVFAGCSNLTSIEIPNSVTYIGGGAFNNCSNLTSIKLPNQITAIYGFTFSKCNRLTSLEIPDGVTIIEQQAIERCDNLRSLSIPDSVITIEAYALGRCTNLTNLNYAGTMEQWQALSKAKLWNYQVPATYVQCSDGQVAL